jgi:glycosyltransferase involved in cell wall biosynthesis
MPKVHFAEGKFGLQMNHSSADSSSANHSVSVIIPTYNGAAFIAEALVSVFAQTQPPREIIVVDDCSTDGTMALVEEIAASAPLPIRLIRLPRNSGGPAKPINAGVAAAKSELIAVLDQDDVFAPDKLEYESTTLACNPEAALAAGLLAFSTTRDQIVQLAANVCRQLEATDPAVPTLLPGSQVLRQLILHGNFFIGYPAFTFRKVHWAAKGGVDEGLPVASDYDLLCNLCMRGMVSIRPSIHYIRRQHEANVSDDYLKGYLDVTRVRARYLMANPWLLRDASVAPPLRDWFSTFGYWVREAGNHRAALECYRLSARIWGWDSALLKAAGKLPLHWLWCKLTRRKSVYMGYTRKRAAATGTAGDSSKTACRVLASK